MDEAHQLPEVATQYFGLSISTRQLGDWLQDLRAEYLRSAADMPEFEPGLADFERALNALRGAASEGMGRQEWDALPDRTAVRGRLETVQAMLTALKPVLDVLAPRSRGLESRRDPAELMTSRLAAFLDDDARRQVRWVEHRGRQSIFNVTPLDAAERFAARMQENHSAWVFTSATLSVGGGFAHFRERLGVAESCRGCSWAAPSISSATRSSISPERMPAVDTSGYTRAVVEAARPVIEASGGRAFMLFTSHRALNEAAELLRGELDYPLLVQGEMPRRRLLETFREMGNAVLLGTSSFWEGVDVKGPALSVVVIDKLPFASPGDPVLKARLDLMQSEGRNPFMEYQLPQAVIALKQGVGRLIRDATDKGVMMICDPRLTGKPYGRVFRESLPPMRPTRDLGEVQRFLWQVFTEETETAP